MLSRLRSVYAIVWGRALFAGSALAAGTVAAFATGSALAAITAFAAGTVATLGALTLYIAFGLGHQGAHREAIFACLLVDLYELDSDFVALLQPAVLH